MKLRILSYYLALGMASLVHSNARSQVIDGAPVLRTDTISTPLFNSIWYFTAKDTLVQTTYAAIEINAYQPNRSKKKSYDRLQQKVIKVYPYAKVAGDVMLAYGKLCQTVTDPREQAKLLDQAEEELKAQFEKDLRSMTISEGVILIKLIDRETGKTSYGLVRELKGKFSAFMWQSVARLFGHDLKDDYDPNGEDVWIENTCKMIEDGSIPIERRQVNTLINQNLSSGR
jgi:hypothetical protein